MLSRVVAFPMHGGVFFGGKELIKMGGRRRIVDGSTTRVFLDQWLPCPHSFRPITILSDETKDFAVADLMISGRREWDKEKVEQVLWPVDSSLVLSIPLGNAQGNDGWFWHFDSKGLYEVRSGYRVVMDSRRTVSSTVQNPDVAFWMKLLELGNPP